MSSVKVRLNTAEVRNLLKSGELQSLLKEEAEQIRSRCGEGYAVDSYVAQTRVVASVYTESFDAMHDNKKNNTLLKAVRK